jgi:hypothetical protein
VASACGIGLPAGGVRDALPAAACSSPVAPFEIPDEMTIVFFGFSATRVLPSSEPIRKDRK